VPNLNATYRLRANGISYETNVTSQTDVATDFLTVREGRRIDHNDITSAARVALLSHPLAQRFFVTHPRPANCSASADRASSSSASTTTSKPA